MITLKLTEDEFDVLIQIVRYGYKSYCLSQDFCLFELDQKICEDLCEDLDSRIIETNEDLK